MCHGQLLIAGMLRDMSTGGWTGLLSRALRIVGDVVRAPDTSRRGQGRRAASPQAVSRQAARTTSPSARTASPSARTTPGAPGQKAYPGDFTGTVRPAYAPDLDGDADPGEIVWTWVPYEEDHSQGKDRPVLVVGHDGPWLLGLMLTSKDHGRGTSSRPGGPTWIDIGTGPWDAKGRESEVRLDRVVRIDPGQVRREGAIMDRALFDRVTALLP